MRNPRAILAADLESARVKLMFGWSLREAAEHIGADPADLDLALWRHLIRHGVSVLQMSRRA